ncbi:MAG TPA: class I SAM-dependent methyltransferase [Oryzihumus sp.]|nr:class I SAM-dependent methyltransferase [Oryzihumus sp.]
MSDVEESLKTYYAGEMTDRAGRPLGDERTACVAAFTNYLRQTQAQAVLEVGCGAGRDGLVLSESGCAYTGVDLSPAAVQTCRDRGLNAVEASATDLPFADDAFDAAWSMSTLMHLPGDGFTRAIQELSRVVRPGSTVAIGVWGHTCGREWTSPDGRYFNHRSDERLQDDLRALGDVVAFDTWNWFEDGGHYQCARVVAR